MLTQFDIQPLLNTAAARFLTPQLEDYAKGIDPEAVSYDPWEREESFRRSDKGYEVSYKNKKVYMLTVPTACTKIRLEKGQDTPAGMELTVLRKDGPSWFWSKKSLYDQFYSPGKLFSGVLLNWDRIYCRHSLKSFRFPENKQNSYFNRNYEVYTNKLGPLNKILEPEVRKAIQDLHGALSVNSDGISYLVYGHIPDKDYLKQILDLLLLVSRRVERINFL